MASAIHPGSPGAQPWREAPTLEPHAPVLETHPRGLPPSRPLSSQALSWGSGSLGLTVLGGGKTYTYSQCPGDGGSGSAEAGGACYPKGQRPSNP